MTALTFGLLWWEKRTPKLTAPEHGVEAAQDPTASNKTKTPFNNSQFHNFFSLGYLPPSPKGAPHTRQGASAAGHPLAPHPCAGSQLGGAGGGGEMLYATQRVSRWVAITQRAESFCQSPKSPSRSLSDAARPDGGREIPRSAERLGSGIHIRHRWPY